MSLQKKFKIFLTLSLFCDHPPLSLKDMDFDINILAVWDQLHVKAYFQGFPLFQTLLGSGRETGRRPEYQEWLKLPLSVHAYIRPSPPGP